MKKILFILTLALSVFAFKTEAKKIALLVGISNYEDAKLGWKNLHANNDLNLLAPALKKAGFEVMTLKNNAATHKAILKKLDQLAKKSKNGDKVFILFSGHGQQMVNTFGDKEKLTETFIPFDAAKKYCDRDKGNKHLTDDELNVKLKAIKASVGAQGELMVALDACHSGDSTRGGSEIDDELIAAVQGGKDVPAQRGDADIFGMGKLQPRPKTKDLAPIPCDFVVAACASSGVSMECRGDDGEIYGSLSYLLFKGIKSNNGAVGFGALYNYVIKNYKKTMRSTPYCRRGGK